MGMGNIVSTPLLLTTQTSQVSKLPAGAWLSFFQWDSYQQSFLRITLHGGGDSIINGNYFTTHLWHQSSDLCTEVCGLP